MITIIYSTHKDETYNNKFKKHLLETCGLKDVQILQYENNKSNLYLARGFFFFKLRPDKNMDTLVQCARKYSDYFVSIQPAFLGVFMTV